MKISLTIMMIKKKFPGIFLKQVCFFALIMPVFGSLYGQTSYGGWYNAGVEVDLPKKFTLDICVEGRSNFDYGLALNQYFPEIGLSYKISKHMDVSGKYRWAKVKEDNGYFYNRNKLYANWSVDYSVERWTVKNRVKYQWQARQFIEDFEDALPDRYLRDKISLSYNVNNNPIEPFASFEIFYPLNSYMINTVDEYRVACGLGFPLAKDHDMEIGLMYNAERFPTLQKSVALLISYQFEID